MRLAIKTYIHIIILLSLYAIPLSLTASDRSKNILVLIADDWGWPHASIAGEPELKTPVFDRVASEGLLFNNAFASAPSCTASRAALLTGQYHWRLEEGANLHSILKIKFPVYTELLADKGFHVGFTRKGWAPGKENLGGRTQNPAGKRYTGFDEFMSARTAGQPFCFWFGSIDPHRAYDRDAGIRARKDPAKVRLPRELPDNDVTRRDMLDYFTEIERFDREVGEILEKLRKSGELDQTLVVITADNGRPFPRGKATVYDAGTHIPLAIRWPGGIKNPGRKIDDFVSLTDLAPTFLDLLGFEGLPDRTGKSLRPIFESDRAGRVDPSRDHVLTGMERHTACRDVGPNLPRGGYPMRALRTSDFLLIHNFESGRWPMGDWLALEKDKAQWPTFEQLSSNTHLTFGDCDAGPSKAWLILNREKAEKEFQLAFGKRAEFELYDLKNDRDQLVNVAADPAYKSRIDEMKMQLDKHLKETKDPRTTGQGDIFSRFEYLGNDQAEAPAKKAVNKKKQAAKKKEISKS
jgi:arylsulfatase A-like enzyme